MKEPDKKEVYYLGDLSKEQAISFAESICYDSYPLIKHNYCNGNGMDSFSFRNINGVFKWWWDYDENKTKNALHLFIENEEKQKTKFHELSYKLGIADDYKVDKFVEALTKLSYESGLTLEQDIQQLKDKYKQYKFTITIEDNI